MDQRCVNAQEAKTQLVPLDPSPRRQLGFLEGHVDDAFFDPLTDDELERWGV